MQPFGFSGQHINRPFKGPPEVKMVVLTKIGIVIVLLGIVASLGSGLFFLMQDRSQSRRTLNALKVRIGLSVALFLLILLGLATGFIEPNASPLGQDGG